MRQLKQKATTCAQASSGSAGQQAQWLAGFSSRALPGAALSLDSNASHLGSLRGSAPPTPPSVPTVITLTDVSRQGPAAAAALAAAAASSKAHTEAASEGGERSANGKGSSFLVQQPSSKLWMEAVPMRCDAEPVASLSESDLSCTCSAQGQLAACAGCRAWKAFSKILSEQF
jgi:hypothetical protein